MDVVEDSNDRGGTHVLTGRITEQVVEIFISPLANGVELTVVSVDRDGREVAAVEKGDAATLRARARTLAARHDLAPAWSDFSWIRSGSRPPASRYVLR